MQTEPDFRFPKKMPAFLCTSFSPEILQIYSQTVLPKPKAGEILIEVRAAGLNFPDLLICEGKYQFRPELPFSPGGECAGIVRAVGSESDRKWLGKRVLAGTTWGSLAGFVVAKTGRIFRLPDEIDFASAGAFGTVFGTVYHALFDRGKLQKGEHLVVLGAAGGIGTAAVKLGKTAGAKVTACVSTPEKAAFAQQNGADNFLIYKEIDLKSALKEIAGPAGTDVVLDPVGGALTEAALRSLGPGGRLLSVGFASGEVPRIPLNLVLLKSCAAVGVFYTGFSVREPEKNRENFRKMFEMVADGSLELPPVRRFKFSEINRALDIIRSRSVQGKLVIEF